MNAANLEVPIRVGEAGDRPGRSAPPPEARQRPTKKPACKPLWRSQGWSGCSANSGSGMCRIQHIGDGRGVREWTTAAATARTHGRWC